MLAITTCASIDERDNPAANEAVTRLFQASCNLSRFRFVGDCYSVNIINRSARKSKLFLEKWNEIRARNIVSLRLLVQGGDASVPFAIDGDRDVRPLGDFGSWGVRRWPTTG